ncbi:MAG: ATP-binding protein [Erysipelotrichaceae bacterium]|nr:ATP-binding protein [Erysipelotrichaceae bacterium]
MAFIGRREELNKLRNLYNTTTYEGVIVYGQRNIGKTELLKKSFALCSYKCIYYECLRASEYLNTQCFSDVISASFGIPKPSFDSFVDAVEYVAKEARINPIVLVIDEYPYIRDVNGVMDSALQKVIDTYKGSSKLKFILCGSYVDVMKGLLTESNPLYKRFSTSLNITQMDYYESSLFYEDYSDEEKVQMYAVLGGVPYYNQFVDTKVSVKQNIINLILDKNGRLAVGPEQFLEQEIAKMTNANEVFTAIARGKSKFSDILDKSHVNSSPALANILNRLIAMDVIVKIFPINNEAEKKSYYSISDRYSLFYYKYVFTKKSMLASMSAETFWDEFIEEDFRDSFVPRCFEVIARQFLVRRNKEGLIKPVLYKVGTYYYDDRNKRVNGEFDVVTLNKQGYDFYEVKFTDKPVDDSVVNEEVFQLKQAGIAYHRLGFFSKSGFSMREKEKYILYSLKDVYEG